MGVTALLAALEAISRDRADRVLRLRGSLPPEAAGAGASEPFELLIFRGFSSSVSHPTAFDPVCTRVAQVAGAPGDDAAATEAAIDALGPDLAPRVLRTGRIDDTSRAWLLRHATVVAYPSLDEGFGFPLLDAMQVGVPLVASTAGSIPEVAGDAALYCDALDIDSIAAALSRVIDDDAERRRLVEAGASRWVTFTWQRCADGIVDLYRSVITGEITR